MNLFNRNNRKSNGRVQQQSAVTKPKLVTVVCRYPHRMDESGDIPTKFIHVKSTAEPAHRYVNYFAWIMHIHTTLGTGFAKFISKGGRSL